MKKITKTTAKAKSQLEKIKTTVNNLKKAIDHLQEVKATHPAIAYINWWKLVDLKKLTLQGKQVIGNYFDRLTIAPEGSAGSYSFKELLHHSKDFELNQTQLRKGLKELVSHKILMEYKEPGKGVIKTSYFKLYE